MAVGFRWSKRSLGELAGIHPDLRRVTDRALELSPHDMIITDGKRTIAEQKHFVKIGASRTMKSRHLLGYAVDYVGFSSGKVTYNAVIMKEIAQAFKAAAKELNIPIEWGGDWKGFVDTPHIQLSKLKYPD